MDELNQEQKDKIKRVGEFAQKTEVHPNLPIVDELSQINESLKTMAKNVPEIQKVTLEGLTIVGQKGEKGEKGEKGDTGESVQGERGERGEKGEKGDKPIAGIDFSMPEDGANGKDGESIVGPSGKDGSPDTGEQIIDKINGDESEKQIKREKVEGLEDEFKNVNERISSIPRGAGARANNSTKFYKLTPDSITKIFTVPKSVTSIVLMSDFPHILFEGSANGFTINNTRTQITLTVDNAPTSGSQLLYQYSSMFN